jgi:hypothetical protein
MSMSLKKESTNDLIRIGDIAAKQPLSGIHIVTQSHIKGAGSTAFVRIEEIKKAS